MVFSRQNRGQIPYRDISARRERCKITAVFGGKARGQVSRLLQVGAILFSFVLLVPSTVFSYAVLWDTSHGVYVSGTFGGDGYQPSQNGYYQTLAEHLGQNGFTVDTTSNGFLVDDPAGYDVIVVCLTSSFYSGYSAAEVARIVDFVDSGGGLLIMGDRLAAPNMNIQPVASEFGVTLGQSDLIPFAVHALDIANHPIFSGVSEIFMYAGAELAVSGLASAVAWQEGTGKTIAAVAQYGLGRVVALGDCSLWSWVQTYEENFDGSDNPEFSVSTFTYLAVPEPGMLVLLGLGAVLLRRRT